MTRLTMKNGFDKFEIMRFFPKTRGHKVFWSIVLFLFFIMMLELGVRYYDQWRGQKRVEELAQALERIEQERYDRMAADTIGGQTPQETLEMFISAVENENYELASKYFILEKQKEELESLQNSPKENIDNVMSLLVKAKNSKGAYLDSEHYFVDSPISIDFILYPSGNWKIEEI